MRTRPLSLGHHNLRMTKVLSKAYATTEDGEGYWENIVNQTPRSARPYYVGPAIAPDFDALLHFGTELLELGNALGLNMAYWHLEEARSGDPFHRDWWHVWQTSLWRIMLLFGFDAYIYTTRHAGHDGYDTTNLHEKVATELEATNVGVRHMVEARLFTNIPLDGPRLKNKEARPFGDQPDGVSSSPVGNPRHPARTPLDAIKSRFSSRYTAHMHGDPFRVLGVWKASMSEQRKYQDVDVDT